MVDEPEINLRTIASFLKAFQQGAQESCRYGQNLVKFSMFQRGKQFPKLRGKAGELRHVGNAVLALWRKFYNPAREIHREILLLLELDLKIDAWLDKYSPADGYWAVPGQIAQKIRKAALQSVSLHTHLSEHFEAEGVHIFCLTSKSHMQTHALLLSKDLHPHLVWCFAGEDFMKIMSRLLLSSVRGLKPAAGIVKGSLKMRTAMHFNFEELAGEVAD